VVLQYVHPPTVHICTYSSPTIPSTHSSHMYLQFPNHSIHPQFTYVPTVPQPFYPPTVHICTYSTPTIPSTHSSHMYLQFPNHSIHPQFTYVPTVPQPSPSIHSYTTLCDTQIFHCICTQ